MLMCRKLVGTRAEDLDWDLPENDVYDEVITSVSAIFLEANMDHHAALLWSSVGQTTGIGIFAMATAQMNLVEQFRMLIRNYVHDALEFESFPKESLLESYGLTLYAHKGTRLFRPMMLVEALRRSNPQLKERSKSSKAKNSPSTTPRRSAEG